MSSDLDFIRNLILRSKNDILQINTELKNLKTSIKEELDDLEELRENVAQRRSKFGEKETIEKESYGNVKLEEEDNENDFCNVTSIFDEEQIY